MPQMFLTNQLDEKTQEEFIHFFLKNLDEFGDSKESISEAFNYFQNLGGNLFYIRDDKDLIAASLVLKTKMKLFLPENFLVYIAVKKEKRGLGLGKKLLDFIKENLKTDICLHVEPHNPAKRLYEREGFTNKYLEMRYIN